MHQNECNRPNIIFNDHHEHINSNFQEQNQPFNIQVHQYNCIENDENQVSKQINKKKMKRLQRFRIKSSSHSSDQQDEDLDKKEVILRKQDIPLELSPRLLHFNKKINISSKSPSSQHQQILKPTQNFRNLPEQEDKNVEVVLNQNLSLKSNKGSSKAVSLISEVKQNSVLNEDYSSFQKEQTQNNLIQLIQEKQDNNSQQYNGDQEHSSDEELKQIQKRRKNSNENLFQQLSMKRQLTERSRQINKYFFILLPSNIFKQWWNLIMIILLIYAALFIPFKISFVDDGEYPTWDIIDYIVDAFFSLDILINFISAYYDDQNNLIVSPKLIIFNYLKGWFAIDFLVTLSFLFHYLQATFPFQIFTSDSKYQGLIRISRLPRLYKLLKMTKLARMLKVMKDSQSVVLFNQTVEVKTGVERVIIANVVLLLSCHIVGCIWHLASSFHIEDSWIASNDYLDKGKYEKYVASIYWSIQTVLTVGYGDISATAWSERLFAIFWMLLSVYIYSFAIGSLTSLLERTDHKNQNYLMKLTILKGIKFDYPGVTIPIYDKIKRELRRENFDDQDLNIEAFLNDLPNNLKIELTQVMYKHLTDEIQFFSSKPSSFIAFVAPQLKNLQGSSLFLLKYLKKVAKQEVIFMQGDVAEEMFFIKSGKVAAIIPEFNNFTFLLVKKGRFFGEIDFLFYQNRRKYTFKAANNCEFYVLQKKIFINAFFSEFKQLGYEFVKEAFQRKLKMEQAYEEAVEFCEANQVASMNERDRRISSQSNQIQVLQAPCQNKLKQFMTQNILTQNFDLYQKDEIREDQFYESEQINEEGRIISLKMIQEDSDGMQGDTSPFAKKPTFSSQQLEGLENSVISDTLQRKSTIIDFIAVVSQEEQENLVQWRQMKTKQGNVLNIWIRINKYEQEIEQKNKQLSELKETFGCLKEQIKQKLIEKREVQQVKEDIFEGLPDFLFQQSDLEEQKRKKQEKIEEQISRKCQEHIISKYKKRVQ